MVDAGGKETAVGPGDAPAVHRTSWEDEGREGSPRGRTGKHRSPPGEGEEDVTTISDIPVAQSWIASVCNPLLGLSGLSYPKSPLGEFCILGTTVGTMIPLQWLIIGVFFQNAWRSSVSPAQGLSASQHQDRKVSRAARRSWLRIQVELRGAQVGLAAGRHSPGFPATLSPGRRTH